MTIDGISMSRRVFNAALLAAFAPLSGCGTRVYRVGFINLGPEVPNAPNVRAFREGMQELGYAEGKTFVFDFRWADQRHDRLPALIRDMVAGKPDVIVSGGGAATAQALKASGTTIPVVFVTGDPVAEGIVTNLARPGTNFTGLSVLGQSIEGKRLELLHRSLPGVRRVAVIWNPTGHENQLARDDAAAAAASLGVAIVWHEASNDGELAQVLGQIAGGAPDALMVLGDPVLGFRRKQIVASANRAGLPGMYFWREFVQDGGLMSYGTSLTATYRRAASYVDRILKGAKPGDLPVEQPTTFELVVNRGTARALGVDLSKTVLANAEVIE